MIGMFFRLNINVYLWRKPVIVQTKFYKNRHENNLPEHLAIISMDGNGRWANNKESELWHESGTKSVKS
jgi:undecaprenyl pyrophosphate synthase